MLKCLAGSFWNLTTAGELKGGEEEDMVGSCFVVWDVGSWIYFNIGLEGKGTTGEKGERYMQTVIFPLCSYLKAKDDGPSLYEIGR